MWTWGWVALCCGGLLGCGGGGDGGPNGGDGGPGTTETPPERCAELPAPGDGPRFRDVTGAWGAGEVLASRVSVGDLDGDGYPDVVVHRTGSHNRADFTQPARRWPYRVLMNREGDDGRRLEDATRESGYGALREDVADTGRAAHFAIFGDVDGDGDLDAYSGTYSDPTQPDTDPGDRSEILLNDGDGTFSLAPEGAAWGFDDDRAVPTSSAAFLDDDRDGVLDLFVGNWYANYGRSYFGVEDWLLRGQGDGTFDNATDGVGMAQLGDLMQRDQAHPTYGVTACDVDLDGDTDLVGSSYGRQWNQLWLREADGFRRAGELSGVDADEGTDYSDNQFYRCHCQMTGECDAPDPLISCDRDYWNEGVDDHPFRLGGNTFTTVCADVDADGDQDLYNAEIVHWHIGSSSDPSQLLVNDGTGEDGVPTFSRPDRAEIGLEVPRVGRSWNEGGIGAALADLDNDGHMDVLLGTSDYPDQALRLYRQRPDGTFREMAAEAGVEHPCAPAMALADLDRDGDLDLLVTSSTMRDCSGHWPDGPELRIYENVTGQDANWTQMHLEGAGPEAGGANRSAIGAIVRVTAGGRTQTREVDGGYGHFGHQHDLDPTFGLGEACRIDEIEVRWPDADGAVERFEDVPARYRLLIRQGEPLRYL